MGVFDSIFHTVTSTGEKVVVDTMNGGEIFTHGWKDVFSGKAQEGISEVGFGLATAAGIPQLVKELTDLAGKAAQWSLQQQQRCYSAYRAHVQQSLEQANIPWNDSTMESTLRQGAIALAYIDMSC